MTDRIRKLRGLLGTGLTWGLGWAIVTAITGLVIGFFDPDSIDPGESVLGMTAIVGFVGFVSGVAFGVLLSLAEGRKAVRDLSMSRAAVCGVSGASMLPVLTPMNDSLLLLVCPLGAAFAAASVLIARRAELRGTEQAKRLSAGPHAR